LKSLGIFPESPGQDETVSAAVMQLKRRPAGASRRFAETGRLSSVFTSDFVPGEIYSWASDSEKPAAASGSEEEKDGCAETRGAQSKEKARKMIRALAFVYAVSISFLAAWVRKPDLV
jgi:hypothetical protein